MKNTKSNLTWCTSTLRPRFTRQGWKAPDRQQLILIVRRGEGDMTGMHSVIPYNKRPWWCAIGEWRRLINGRGGSLVFNFFKLEERETKDDGTYMSLAGLLNQDTWGGGELSHGTIWIVVKMSMVNPTLPCLLLKSCVMWCTLLQ